MPGGHRFPSVLMRTITRGQFVPLGHGLLSSHDVLQEHSSVFELCKYPAAYQECGV